MKRILLAATAMLTTLTAAHAAFHCEQSMPQAGKNPAVTAWVQHETNGYWRIVHALRDGTQIERLNQYDIRDASDNTQMSWKGWNKRGTNLWMHGVVRTLNGHYIYIEEVYNSANNLVGSNMMICDAIQNQTPAPAPVVADNKPMSYVAFVTEGNNVLLPVAIGNLPITMLLDTGATQMSINQSISNQLLQTGQAVAGKNVDVTIADGSTVTMSTIIIANVTVAGRTLHNVPASVTKDGAMQLLPLPVLYNLSNKVSIDFPGRKITFE